MGNIRFMKQGSASRPLLLQVAPLPSFAPEPDVLGSTIGWIPLLLSGAGGPNGLNGENAGRPLHTTKAVPNRMSDAEREPVPVGGNGALRPFGPGGGRLVRRGIFCAQTPGHGDVCVLYLKRRGLILADFERSVRSILLQFFN